MKNILYIHQYFKTPEEGGALRSYFIAGEMVKRGMGVQMIAAHNKTTFECKNIEGIMVYYLPVRYSNKMSFVSRYFAFLRYVIGTIRLSGKLTKPDLVYATSTPLTVGIIALWLKWRRKIPYIFEVRDLWPEAPIQLGILRNATLKWLATNLEKYIYKSASKIIALSPGIQAGILRKVPEAQVIVASNMSDISFFQNSDLKPGPKRFFTIGYFGTLGLANNVEFILSMAKTCKEHHLPIKFLVAGDGLQKKYFEETAKKNHLTNIEQIQHQNRFGIRALMNDTDACLTTFLDVPVLETNSPNKFFDALAAGKLCLVNTRGWLKDLVEKNKCGIYVDTNRPDLFPEQIEPFIQDKSLLQTYQRNALLLGKNQFSRENLASMICDEVEKMP